METITTKKSKVDIINETAQFYNLNNRSIAENGRDCMYKGLEGKECAFQRCVETDLSSFEGQICSSFTDVTFKAGYEGHDLLFWRDIQYLHDIKDNWTKTGLSELGQSELTHLINKYKDQ